MKVIPKSYQFNSRVNFGKTKNIGVSYNEDDIRKEPMLFSCDYEHAKKLGGPITQHFLYFLVQEMPQNWHADDIIIDSRVHMLFPNFYPAIPGWHHDSVLRTREDGQPNYQENNQAEHCMMLLNGDIAPTHFFEGEIELFDVPIGQKVYKTWSPEIEIYGKDTHKILPVPSNRLIFFNWETFHKASKAVNKGWRLFIRASFNDKSRKPANEVRTQVQVYLLDESEGW